MTKSTGIDVVTAGLVPVGATLNAATWHVAHLYGPSIEEYASQAHAVRAALAEHKAAEERHKAHYRLRNGDLPSSYVPLPETMVVDLRWHMSGPDGGGAGFTASRITYESVAEAQEYLARVEKYARA